MRGQGLATAEGLRMHALDGPEGVKSECMAQLLSPELSPV